MRNTNRKAKVLRSQDALPEHFGSIEEAAEFWDTHDSADYEEHMTDASVEVDVRQRTYLISLDPELYSRVRAIAKKKGVPAEELVNLWIEEKAS